jgi:glyoxylase-like metal-dependent hydrolase (beta-lactamase superfamily II)
VDSPTASSSLAQLRRQGTTQTMCCRTGVHRSRDTLFPGGVGRTTSPSDFESLINDVSSRIFDYLPDDTWFYPGHGDDSTLGEQRPHLSEWRSRGW